MIKVTVQFETLKPQKGLQSRADLQFSGSLFLICGSEQLNSAPPCSVLSPGTESRPEPADLRSLDASERSS